MKKFTDTLGISENNELFASAQMTIEDRLASPFYGYFLVSWLTLNWQTVYATLFVDQETLFEKTGLLKPDYVELFLWPVYTWSFYLHYLLAPLALTILFVWYLPYITRIFFRKNIRNRVALKVIELQELSQEKKEEKKLTQEDTALMKTEIERAKVEKKAAQENPEVLWEREYYQFRVLPLFKKFTHIVASIYEYSGRITVVSEYNDRIIFQIPKDVLAHAHTNDLVIFEKGKEKIDLTDKGKFFVRKFTADTSISS